jgi:hypothetical protein
MDRFSKCILAGVTILEDPLLEQIREHLVYDEETGVIHWKRRFNAGIKPHLRAGYVEPKGYVSVYFQGKAIKAHRLAWLLHTGAFPNGVIDHINGDKTDNRISNLRDTTTTENGRNRKQSRTNLSGVTGVHWRKDGVWQAQIRVNGKTLHLGRYRSLECAAAARKDAERLYGFHPNHGRVAA